MQRVDKLILDLKGAYMQEFPDIYEKFLNFDDLEDREIEEKSDSPKRCDKHEWVPLFNENHLVCKHCGVDKVEV